MHKKVRTITRDASKIVWTLTDGLLSHAVDIGLWSTLFLAEYSLPFQASTKKSWRARVAADRFLYVVNYEIIKNAIVTAKRNGWIKKSRRHAAPEITNAGKKRLTNLIPHYDAERVWDGRLHLVIYDIPETRSGDRHLLREYLKRLGCGRLQDSVWITPYDPIDTLRSFIEERALGGAIIVSNMGKDGSVGEEDVRALIVRVYGLIELNSRYEKLIEEVDDMGVDHWIVIKYLSILRDDPQLPFALLPPWWKGDEVYKRVSPFLQRLIV